MDEMVIGTSFPAADQISSTLSPSELPVNRINDTSFDLGLSEVYDYIVVGGGTAGLVVASRLTENPELQVLVLEAGANRLNDPRIMIPGLALSTWSDPDFDWCFKTTPQHHLDGRIIAHPRGRTLGGSTAINLSMMAYPSKVEVDSWAKLGNPDWTWESMVPWYRKFHTYVPPSKEIRELLALDYVDDDAHGKSGPIKISYGEEQGPLQKAWPETFRGLKLEMTGDPLSGLATGGQSNPATIDPKTKTRSHAGSSYYSPEVAKRPNLRVLTEVFVEKIVLQKSEDAVTATGVQFTTKEGLRRIVQTRKEVVLAAGSIKSPQILELSGIGSTDLLKSFGINVFIDNCNVGANLQDHAVAHLSFEVADGTPSADVFRDPQVVEAIMSQYQTSKTGPMTASTYSSAFIPIAGFRNVEIWTELLRLLDEQVSSVNGDASLSHKAQYDLLRAMLKDKDDSSAQFFIAPFQCNSHDVEDPQLYMKPTTPGNYLTVFVALSHPFSRGSVHINSSDPAQKPIIDPRYLSNPLDEEIFARHVQFIEDIVETEPLASLIKKDGRRIPADTYVRDIEAAKKRAKQLITNFHPVGTCAMMPKEIGGVVDQRLMIHSASNIRVVDASIIPLIPRGNIQSNVYAIAEKAAHLIIADWRRMAKENGEHMAKENGDMGLMTDGNEKSLADEGGEDMTKVA